MFNYKFFFVFVLIFTVSCKDYLFKKPVLINNEQIDFKTIDSYPLMPECEDLVVKEQQKDCFYKTLSTNIQLSLLNNNLVTTNIINDTILVKILVNNNGKLVVKSINYNHNIKHLDSLITNSIKLLPVIQPAIKMGIPIKTEYILPIILKSTK